MARGGAKKRKKQDSAAASNAGATSEFDLPLFSGTQLPKTTQSPRTFASDDADDVPLETGWRDVLTRSEGTQAPPFMPQFVDDDDDDDEVESGGSELVRGWAGLTEKILQGQVPIGYPGIIVLLTFWAGAIVYLVLQQAGRGKFDDVAGRLQCAGIASCITAPVALLLGIVIVRIASPLLGGLLLLVAVACLAIGASLLAS